MDCAENSMRTTDTAGTAKSGFDTFADAQNWLLDELMEQVELDRELAGLKCGDRQCAEGANCVTIFPARAVAAVSSSIFAYRRPGGGTGYGYEWGGGPVDSACRCVLEFVDDARSAQSTAARNVPVQSSPSAGE